MASFTDVGDSVTLVVPNAGEVIDVDISGTYNMTIQLQREIGSPGSGSWVLISEYSTEDATVADQYTTLSHNESLRLIVTVDTSGTATATLTDNDDRAIHDFRDRAGNLLMSLRESGMVVNGSFSRNGTSALVDVTDATVTLTAATHAGKVVTLNRAAGVTVTLPAATGTGNVYKIFTGTTVTSNANVIQAASSADSMGGGVSISTDIAGVTMLCAATTDTISQNGTTTGGVIGSWVEITDVASGKFMVNGFLASTGTEATPFSAAV